MYAPNNIFSPASGEPIANPTQDIAIGCFYLTREEKETHRPLRSSRRGRGALRPLPEGDRPARADQGPRLRRGRTDDEQPLPLRGDDTTVGRVIFNQIFPPEIGYSNKQVNKKELSELISRCYKLVGQEETVKILDKLKDLGFEYATWSGVSLGMSD